MSIAGMAAGLGMEDAGGWMGAFGSYLGAKSKNRAGKNALNTSEDLTNWGKLQQVYEALGSQGGRDYLRATMPVNQYERIFGPGATPGSPARAGGTTNGQDMNIAANVAALDKAFAGTGTLGQISDISQRGQQGIADIQSQYARDTGSLSRQGATMLNTAQQWGKGREATIERDFGQAQRNAEQTSQADLIASGLGGSSLMSNNRAQIGRQFGYGMQDAKQQLAQAQIDRVLGVQSGNRSMSAERAAGGTQLGQQSLQATQAMQMAPVQARQQIFSGATFNPFLGQQTTQYFPGLSPWGSLLVNKGQNLQNMGGQVFGASSGTGMMGGMGGGG